MGFVLAQFAGSQAPRGQAIGPCPLRQRVEAGNFVVVGRHDQLAAPFVRDTFFGAESVERLAAFGAQLGLERAGAIVEPGMDHAAVVSSLVGG